MLTSAASALIPTASVAALLLTPSNRGEVLTAEGRDGEERENVVSKDISSEGEQRGGGKDGSATAEGLMALAAELTCPVW